MYIGSLVWVWFGEWINLRVKKCDLSSCVVHYWVLVHVGS